jgi:F0F1-type ATP synthase assembly protein I
VKLTPRKPVNAESNVGRGIEFALGIAIFLGLGYLMDSWLGTKPVFMIVLFLVGVIGQFASLWYRYQASMSSLDDQRRADSHRHHNISASENAASATDKGLA